MVDNFNFKLTDQLTDSSDITMGSVFVTARIGLVYVRRLISHNCLLKIGRGLKRQGPIQFALKIGLTFCLSPGSSLYLEPFAWA